MDEAVYLAGAVRTPIGRFGGALAALTAVELGVSACRAALERAGLPADAIDQTILGQARQAGCGPNPARQVGAACGVPVERPAFTVNQACLSGMQAILCAARAIRLGEADTVLVGGMESMSRVPHLIDARWGWRMGHRPVVDGMYRDGFLDPLSGLVMGETAEELARRCEISRSAQDDWAALSQQRCEKARRAGRFEAETVALTLADGSGERRFALDEHPRDGVTAEALSRLPAVFRKDGSVTAGNSSGITDGAAALVVLSAEAVKRLRIEPQARLLAHSVVGVDPVLMGLGPVPAVRRLLDATGLTLDAIDLIELNEAFAAQVLAVNRELDLDHERVNVNGGAIALGHPIGCSGARIVVTLLHELARRGARRGLATLCVSGGMGGALLVER